MLYHLMLSKKIGGGGGLIIGSGISWGFWFLPPFDHHRRLKSGVPHWLPMSMIESRCMLCGNNFGKILKFIKLEIVG